jgi:lipopolysaccharide/colanic/teichoic acid biosynthesis glycosyltransferase
MDSSNACFELRKRRRCKTIKRVIDIAASLAALVVLSPLLILIALLVRILSKGPSFFSHKRVGMGGKEFYVYKFRTMMVGAEDMKCRFTEEQKAEFQENYKLIDDPRITTIGRILRKCSLDELPQFFNVLKGEMSVVGPRPVTEEELLKYGENADLLLSVKPGITGLWQISGRNCISYEDRVQLDILYVMNHSFLTDLRICIATIRTVISRMGAY